MTLFLVAFSLLVILGVFSIAVLIKFAVEGKDKVELILYVTSLVILLLLVASVVVLLPVAIK